MTYREPGDTYSLLAKRISERFSPTAFSPCEERGRKPIAFIWENFGPGHADRCEAVAKQFSGKREIYGIELVGSSEVYEWKSETRENFKKITLFDSGKLSKIGVISRSYSTLRACLQCGASDVFLCHYEHPATFLTASILRILGRRTYIMNDSKYDDYPRYLWREIVKRCFYFPYWGGIASGFRSADYLRFLGIRKERISGNYNSLSVERIIRLSGSRPAPQGVAYNDRHFTIIARFIDKKNIFVAISAFKMFQDASKKPRQLHICGSGPLEQELRSFADKLGISHEIRFRGFIQTEEVCQVLAQSLALILASTEEQFGNVVIEALAMGVPVIISDNCGARDHLIRSGVNGFLVEPDNPNGIAFFMDLLSTNEDLWRSMSYECAQYVLFGDVRHFAEAVQQLVGMSR